jgi:hypothetical protein
MAKKGRTTNEERQKRYAEKNRLLEQAQNIEIMEPEEKTTTKPTEKTNGKSDNGSDVTDPLLTSKTIEREHSKPHIDVKGTVPFSMEEPHIDAPTIDFNARPPDANIDGTGGSENNGATKQPVHEVERKPISEQRGNSLQIPGYTELNSRQKTVASEYLADTIINGYSFLNEGIKKFLMFDEEKMRMKAIDGKFDMAVLQLEMPLSEIANDTISVGAFLGDVNEKIDRLYTVSEKYKHEIKPLLVEYLKEHGLGMSLGWQIAALTIEEAAPKLQGFFAIKSAQNSILKVGMHILGEMKKQNEHATQQPTHTVIVTPAPETKQPSGEVERPSDREVVTGADEIRDVERVQEQEVPLRSRPGSYRNKKRTVKKTVRAKPKKAASDVVNMKEPEEMTKK